MKSLVIAAMALALGAFAFAQEHPEHPTDKPAAKKGYTMDQLEQAITAEIRNQQSADPSGNFHIKDGDKTWNLKLDHVHKERLSRTDEKTYFACTDFKSDDNHTVDVDFFMKDDGDKLVLADQSLHKVDGKARYNWKEKNGYWVKVPVQ